MKEPQGKATQVQQVTTNNAKRVEAGKRLVESNLRREKGRNK